MISLIRDFSKPYLHVSVIQSFFKLFKKRNENVSLNTVSSVCARTVNYKKRTKSIFFTLHEIYSFKRSCIIYQVLIFSNMC